MAKKSGATGEDSLETPLVASAVQPPKGSCAIDVRIFLLTITIAMSLAFFAGVSVNLDTQVHQALALLSPSTTATDSCGVDDNRELDSPHEELLTLSPADLHTSQAHSPSGQHLLVDISGIDADFLDSEERLSDAMVKTVQAGGLTMLSYHCHKLMPAGISCVGVLLESHISFHTWPEEGVITLDLFTCGANPLLPVVPVIERLFGVGKNIDSRWSHELRGFRSMDEKKRNYLDDFSDLAIWILSPLEVPYKKLIYSNVTKYQRIDIWDLRENEDAPTYEDGIKHNIPDGDPRWMTSELATPDRHLFLDGTVQSIYSSEATYHEALVHPGMFTHANPKTVAVLGGGEGATVREILKHKSVDKVTMIEIDAEMIEVARQYLPLMSNCSDLEGRADNCFDDERTEVVNANGIQWFVERFGPEPIAHHDKFSVVIIDALDPEDDVPFSHDLYADTAFVDSLINSMTDDGVMVIQVGTVPELSDPNPEVGMYAIREQLFRMLEAHSDVAAMHVYEEGRSGFLEPHGFLVVCREISCNRRWFAPSDTVEYEIYDRTVHSKSGKDVLKFYDGIVQYAYQAPTMAWEAVYCRREPMPFECAYRSLPMDAEVHEYYLDDDDRSSFKVELKTNDGGKVVGSSVVAKVDIPKGSFIMPEHLAKSVVLLEESLEETKTNLKLGGAAVLEAFVEFVEQNSHKMHVDGLARRLIEIGGTVLIRKIGTEEEANVGPWVPMRRRPTYSPVYDRHQISFDIFMVATKDIPAGAELTRFESMWA